MASEDADVTPHKSPPKPSPEPTPTPSLPHQQQPPPPPPHSSPNPTTPSPTVLSATASATHRPPDPPSSDADVLHVPSYSRWFSWNNIHECEVRHLPEFFDGRSPSRTPKVYKYYRNTIIRRFRNNPPPKKITFTDVRRTIIGDVGSIRRVFDFLETWGLINYAGSVLAKQQSKWEDKETKANAAAAAAAAAATAAGDASSGGGSAAADAAVVKKRLCNGCKTVCNIACFASEKYDLTLCARCYVRGNYRVGVNSSDFKRVELSEEVKTDWTDKESLHLLEAVMHYGDNWKKVAEHVGGGRTDKECVARFIKLPFGEQFDGPPESTQVDNEVGSQASLPPAKRKRLSPLADASNPIMAQAAFLSALAGVEVSEVAAHAALIALADWNSGKTNETLKALSGAAKQGFVDSTHPTATNITSLPESDNASNGNATTKTEGALAEARVQLQKEEDELERAVSAIAVQIKELEDKIVHFEEFDLETEKGWQQVQQLQNLLFVDQLKLVFNKSASAKAEDISEETVKAE